MKKKTEEKNYTEQKMRCLGSKPFNLDKDLEKKTGGIKGMRVSLTKIGS